MKHLIFFLSLLGSISVKADHMGGGEMLYTHLGNNHYRITLVKFLQCSESLQKTDATFWIYHNATLVQEVIAPLISETTYSDNVLSPCVSSNESQCMRKAVFTTEAYLPSVAGNYIVTYQRCCLSYAIDNVVNPNTIGLTTYCTIPGSFANSSPVFNTNPPVIVCRDLQRDIDLSATDPDGDQLVYELFTPFNGGSTSTTVPSPAPPPPYFPIPWENGFDTEHQLGTSSFISMDPVTGNLTLNATTIGNFYIGVRVKEYRNAVLIGEVNRSFILRTTNCTQILNVSINSEDSACFANNSFDFDAYISNPFATANWNFGSHASISSSTDFDVFGVSFDTTGIIPITLTVSYNGCVKTIHRSVTVVPESTIGVTIDPELKCAPYTAQFINLSEPNGPVSYQWTFDDGLFSNEVNPQFTYTNPGTYNVGLVMITQGLCPDTLSLQLADYMLIHPSPQSMFDATYGALKDCQQSVQFTDLSSGADSVFYAFGDGTYSNDLNPDHFYGGTETYLSQQIVTNNFGCKDTSSLNIVVDQPTVYIPNSFSPNSDERNQVFNPVTAFEVQSWDLRIYTRWRDLMYISHDPTIGWDGTYTGKIAPPDTYIYVLEYTDCNGKMQTIEGHVNLLK